MDLAKQCIDVGLFTNRRKDMFDFWQQEIGLPYDHLGKLGAGVQQHRHHMNGSIFKLNQARDTLPDEPVSGYQELTIAMEGLTEARNLTDPDGNKVILVPPGTNGITGIGIKLGVRDPVAFHTFYRDVLQLTSDGESAYRVGTSKISFFHDPSAIRTGDWWASGYRYITIQVFKADQEHAAILARGGEEGQEPRTIGTTARYSFVRDPDGNWIEISQRAQLTGSLD
jgi:catechol 2,3-dioxygenase-like lactoylglutathione lyase family enzyme